VIRPVLAAHTYIKGRLDQIMHRTVHPDSEITLLRREIEQYRRDADANRDEITQYQKTTIPRLTKVRCLLCHALFESDRSYE
jgi:hypothetical protein